MPALAMLAERDVPLDLPGQRALVALSIVFPVLALILVGLRFYSRSLKQAGFGMDDWLLVAGLVFYLYFVTENIASVVLWGLGAHMPTLSMSQVMQLLYFSPINQIMYGFTMGCVRWSVCALLLRIFTTPVFRRLVQGVLIFNICQILFNTFAVAFRCVPYEKNYNPEVPGTCADEILFVSIVAGWGLLVEVFIWVLPIPMIWRLNMATSKKFAIASVFALGILDIAIGIVRVVTVAGVDITDFSFSTTAAIEWILVEQGVAFIVACLPACRPAIRRLFGVGSFTSRSGKDSSNSRATISGKRGTRASGMLGDVDDHIELVGRGGFSSASAQSAMHIDEVFDSKDSRVDAERAVFVHHELSIDRAPIQGVAM